MCLKRLHIYLYVQTEKVVGKQHLDDSLFKKKSTGFTILVQKIIAKDIFSLNIQSKRLNKHCHFITFSYQLFGTKNHPLITQTGDFKRNNPFDLSLLPI